LLLFAIGRGSTTAARKYRLAARNPGAVLRSVKAMQANNVLCFVFVAASVGSAMSCSTNKSEPTVGVDAGGTTVAGSTCSTGSSYSCEESLSLPEKDIPNGGLPYCPLPCDYKPDPEGTALRSYLGIPRGACAAEGYRCSVAVEYSWCGLRNGLVCDCVDGTWQCALTSPGGAACGCGCGEDGPPDAGCDAGK
jgi:hypothetical protein